MSDLDTPVMGEARPLILASNEANAADIAYEDITGVSYEFPRRYRNLIVPGATFIYYRGSRAADSNRLTPVYYGTGIIGTIRPSGTNADRLVGHILDYVPFDVPVPFKGTDGTTLEPGGSVGGRYYQVGVRAVSQSTFGQILEAAEMPIPGYAAQKRRPERESPPLRERGNSYASLDVAEAVEACAKKAALSEVQTLYPHEMVQAQPRYTPGFDILVGTPDAPTRYVAVKGSQARYARFFLSEGERQFAAAHANHYTLFVVYSIDINRGTYETFKHSGAMNEHEFDMMPTQWACAWRQRSEGRSEKAYSTTDPLATSTRSTREHESLDRETTCSCGAAGGLAAEGEDIAAQVVGVGRAVDGLALGDEEPDGVVAGGTEDAGVDGRVGDGEERAELGAGVDVALAEPLGRSHGSLPPFSPRGFHPVT